MQVNVVVSATRKTGRVPYKYRYQDTAIDGRVRNEATAADGIFEGVQSIDLRVTATDDRGNPKQVTEDKEDVVRELPIGA